MDCVDFGTILYLLTVTNPFAGSAVINSPWSHDGLSLMVCITNGRGRFLFYFSLSLFLSKKSCFLECDARHFWIISYKSSTKQSSFTLYLICDFCGFIIFCPLWWHLFPVIITARFKFLPKFFSDNLFSSWLFYFKRESISSLCESLQCTDV